MKLQYRPEIDGLRAIAIISVVLYHAQIDFFGKDYFVGGYIGVDIFFVISGYLISRIILSEIRLNTSFNFLNFYERRARRILPILIIVALVSLIYAINFSSPSKLIELSQSIIASFGFFSNFYFYLTTSDYGAQSSLLMPFLHTWSLSIEEQFYLIFPFIILLSLRYAPSKLLSILSVIVLLSILIAQLVESKKANLNFFFPLSRFWELFIGSILAYIELYKKKHINFFIKTYFPF